MNNNLIKDLFFLFISGIKMSVIVACSVLPLTFTIELLCSHLIFIIRKKFLNSVVYFQFCRVVSTKIAGLIIALYGSG